MAVENIAWMINGGKHSAASGRRVLYKSTGGSEGVADIADLKVRQATVAGGTVIVGAGGATMVSRYAGVRGESYDGQNNTDTVVNVPANGGGSTRYDLVIAYIDDWNFPGQQAVPLVLPTDTVSTFKFKVITGVASTTRTAKQLNLGYPAIALALIAVPAATSAITNAMLTDLRQKAVLQSKRDLLAKETAVARNWNLDTATVGGKVFPDDALWNSILVPDWATAARVIGTWGTMLFPGTGSSHGDLWVSLGESRGDKVVSGLAGYDNAEGSAPSRATMTCSDTIAIPATMRGQFITVALRGKRIVGPPTNYLKADAKSSVSLDIQWVEDPTGL